MTDKPERLIDEFGKAALEHVHESWWARRKARSATKRLALPPPQGPAADDEEAPRPPGWLPGDVPLQRYSFAEEVAKDYAATKPSVEELKRRSAESAWAFDDRLSLEGLQAESIKRRDEGRLPQSTINALKHILRSKDPKLFEQWLSGRDEEDRRKIAKYIDEGDREQARK